MEQFFLMLFGSLNGGGGGSSDSSADAGGQQLPSSDEILQAFQKHAETTVQLVETAVAAFNQISSSLSCWGSNWNPSRARDFVSHLGNTHNNALAQIGAQISPDNVDVANAFLIDYAKSYRDEKSANWGNPNGCTGRTLKKMIPELDAIHNIYLDFFVDIYESIGWKVSLGQYPMSYPPHQNGYVWDVNILRLESYNPVTGIVGENVSNAGRALISWALFAGIFYGVYRGFKWVLTPSKYKYKYKYKNKKRRK